MFMAVTSIRSDGVSSHSNVQLFLDVAQFKHHMLMVGFVQDTGKHCTHSGSNYCLNLPSKIAAFLFFDLML